MSWVKAMSLAGTVLPIREWTHGIYTVMGAITMRILAEGNDDSIEAHARPALGADPDSGEVAQYKIFNTKQR